MIGLYNKDICNQQYPNDHSHQVDCPCVVCWIAEIDSYDTHCYNQYAIVELIGQYHRSTMRLLTSKAQKIAKQAAYSKAHLLRLNGRIFNKISTTKVCSDTQMHLHWMLLMTGPVWSQKLTADLV